MTKDNKEKDEGKKKNFFKRMIEKVDKKMKEKAKNTKCCNKDCC